MQKLHRGQFYGETNRALRVGRFVLTETSYAPGAVLPRHSHEHPYFCVVLDGSFEETCGRSVLNCRPRSIITHPIGDTHEDRFSNGGGTCFNIEVDRSFIEGDTNLSAAFIEKRLLERLESGWLALRLYGEFRDPDESSDLSIEGLGLELLASAWRTALRRENGAPNWLKAAEELIRARFQTSLIFSEVASQVGAHPAHLAREFRRFYGCTMGEYVRRVRVAFARERLVRSDRAPLALIAHEAGFADQSHFTRTFKRMTGMLPSKFRSQYPARYARSNRVTSVQDNRQACIYVREYVAQFA